MTPHALGRQEATQSDAPRRKFWEDMDRNVLQRGSK